MVTASDHPYRTDRTTTRRCTCSRDSLCCRRRSRRPVQNHANSRAAPEHAQSQANGLRIGFSWAHPPVALIRTRFAHSWEKITDRASYSAPAAAAPCRAASPTSCKPVEITRSVRYIAIYIYKYYNGSHLLTRKACFSPPLSAIFSPCVILPSMYMFTSLIL